nr:EOG090X0HIV [Artemia franciscana]
MLKEHLDGKGKAAISNKVVMALVNFKLASYFNLVPFLRRLFRYSGCIFRGNFSAEQLLGNVNFLGGLFSTKQYRYIRATAALCIITLFTDAFATLLTGLGLKSEDPEKKYKYYRLAVYIMLLSLISVLVGLIIYPVCFADELAAGNRLLWEFGWAYGVGWGASIFLFGAIVLLLCDKESEEIYYKERDIIQDNFIDEKA